MNLNKASSDFFGWNISVFKKLWRHTASQAVLSVLFFGFSQLFLIIAMFLPLKVIILLSTNTVPAYLSAFMTTENKLIIVYGLVGLAFILYLLFVLFEWAFKKYAYKGAELLLNKSNKIQFFDNQKFIASELYLRYCKMIASFGIIFIVFGFGLFINVEAFISLILLVIFQYASILILYKYESNISTWITDNLNVFLNILSSINFLMVFLFLVLQYRINTNFSIFIALISIILTRQAMQRLHGTLLDANYLVLNQIKFNALFYSNIQYLLGSNRQNDEFIDFISHNRRNSWITEVIKVVNGSSIFLDDIVADWRDSGTANIGCFDVRVGDENSTCYTIKIFAPNRIASCKHERLLFVEMGNTLKVLPTFIGATSFDDYEVQVYSLISQKMIDVPQWKITLNELFLTMWCTPPTERLIDIYTRSRPLLHQRLKLDVLDLLIVACIDEKEEKMVKVILNKLDKIIAQLVKAPLFIFNPEMVRAAVFVEGDKKYINSWSRWTLEPVGAGLPVPNDDQAIELASEIIKHHSVPLTVDELLYNAYIYEFEKCLQRQNLREAMTFVSRIIGFINEK